MYLVIALAGSIVAQSPSATPNDFLTRGAPTIIVGTAGDDDIDRAIRVQATMVRDLLFPKATITDDVAVELTKGPAAWPANPILYGGPHVNEVLAKLGASLPFRMEGGKLTVGDQHFEGDEYRLITVVPARTADEAGPGNPEFLLYAGTGLPGIGEINSVQHGGESILVADDFGRLLAGNWLRADDGTIVPSFAQRMPRIAWRTVDRALETTAPAGEIVVHFRFPRQLPAADDEAEVIQTCLAGLRQATEKLGDVKDNDLSVYVYPDLGSIASLTGKRGDGHAVVETRVLHVVRYDPDSDAFAQLLAHEGTHALAYDTWEAAGTPLLGEGLAVWVAGAYGGTTLDDWKRRVSQPVPSVDHLLGKSFRQLPENNAYPLAGIFVGAAVDTIGLANVREHLYGATPTNWESACADAGTTPEKLEAAFREAVRGN